MFRNLKENACFDNSDLYRLVRYSLGKKTDENIDEFLKMARRQSNYFMWGYYENEKLVGLMIYKVESDTAKIDVISVEKDERGKGIGKRLLNQVHDNNRTLKFEAVCPEKAKNFFLGLGFAIISLGKNYYDEESFKCTKEYEEYKED